MAYFLREELRTKLAIDLTVMQIPQWLIDKLTVYPEEPRLLLDVHLTAHVGTLTKWLEEKNAKLAELDVTVLKYYTLEGVKRGWTEDELPIFEREMAELMAKYPGGTHTAFRTLQ